MSPGNTDNSFEELDAKGGAERKACSWRGLSVRKGFFSLVFYFLMRGMLQHVYMLIG